MCFACYSHAVAVLDYAAEKFIIIPKNGILNRNYLTPAREQILYKSAVQTAKLTVAGLSRETHGDVARHINSQLKLPGGVLNRKYL